MEQNRIIQHYDNFLENSLISQRVPYLSRSKNWNRNVCVPPTHLYTIMRLIRYFRTRNLLKGRRNKIKKKEEEQLFLTEVEIKSGDKFDKNISSLNKRLSYKGKKDWLISYWNYRKTLFSLKEEATKRSFSSSSMHTKDRDIVSISPDTIFLIKRILFDLSKKRIEGGGKKCNKADSLESLHTALTENTCS